ncbi:hypothetical protein LC612_35350 [Nostoc sp. CHAB 5834]|nr:hypothetical protein [Nostoc sp. CHAB 5834]
MELFESIPSLSEVLQSFPLTFLLVSVALVLGMGLLASRPRGHAVFRWLGCFWWVVGLLYLSRMVKGDITVEENSVFAVSMGLSVLATGLMRYVFGGVSQREGAQ